MNKIRKGDQVIVLTGRDKGRRGTVLSRVDEERLIVEGVNVVKKHVKPNPMKGITGGVIDKTLSIHQSNVAIFNAGDRQGRSRRHQALQRRREEVAQDRRARHPRVPLERRRDQGLKRLSWLVCKSSIATRSSPTWSRSSATRSTMQAPRITKITLNMGVSEAVSDKKVMDHAVSDLSKIAGQKPVVTKSKKAIAGFKIRDGVPIGCMVTLRGVRMYEFLDRFVTIALPRVRDFRGISSRAFDGRGNYNVGVKEQIIFPELDYDKIDVLRGLNISITTTAKTDEECRALLTSFKFPFKT